MKTIVIEINACKDCLYKDEWLEGADLNEKIRCSLISEKADAYMPRLIKNPDKIPDWCPL